MSPNCAANRSVPNASRVWLAAAKSSLKRGGPVLADQAVEGMRQGEDQMEIRDGQEGGRLLGEPVHRLGALAVRAMAVAATVGHDVFAPAMRAIERLAAQRAGPALGQGAERFPLVGRKPQVRRRRRGEKRTQNLPQRGARRHDAGGSWERSSSCSGPAICASRSCRTCR